MVDYWIVWIELFYFFSVSKYTCHTTIAMSFMFKFVNKTYKISTHYGFCVCVEISILTIAGPEEPSSVETSGGLIHTIIFAALQKIEFKIW